MDEIAFMQALGSINPKPCVFGKVILSRLCACPKVSTRYAAEREMIECSDESSRLQCAELLDLLRNNSAFALKLTHVTPPLPHGPEMRVQCGGLLGLQLVVDGSKEVVDISALVAAAHVKFGSLEELPYSTIVQSVVSCEVRKKRPLAE
ncbi:MAG: hypothetical protein ACOH1I_08805 [Gallionellaceae bacterium]